jgi:hypothetical protein
MLDRLHVMGNQVGLFSTRSPHRPNPIGLTVVRIEAVKGNTIHISGVDMCHNTPILDVKPYIPFDFVPEHIVPAWVTAEDVPKWDLRISAEAEASLREIADRRRSPFYATYADFVALLRDVLLQDVRSVHQGRGSVAEAPTQVRGPPHPLPQVGCSRMRSSAFSTCARLVAMCSPSSHVA